MKRTISKPKAQSPQLDGLLFLIGQSYNKKAWHGTNLRGSIRGLSAHEAAWRPGTGRHNIWEIVVHCAYWKYIVRRRIFGEKKGSFPLKGSNWFQRSTDLSEQAWREDIKLLESCHVSLLEAVAQLSDRELTHIPKGSKVSNLAIIAGIASHDIYHAGQIQLLKRLQH
ncbi:MAG: DinB family protein [Ignavibacteria bacterium]|nr:DinB family protein [Ignavibacteria bacterium]